MRVRVKLNSVGVSNRQPLANKRANVSESEAEQCRVSNRLCLANKRANESESEAEQRRAKNCCLIAGFRAEPEIHCCNNSGISWKSKGGSRLCVHAHVVTECCTGTQLLCSSPSSILKLVLSC